MCNADSTSCLVYTEKRKFYRGSNLIETCLQATVGLDAERTLCGGSLLANTNDNMSLDGIPCHAPRLCGASPLDPRTIYDCTNVDGESLINECEHKYEGFLGRAWQRYGSASEYQTVGRCIFNLAADAAASPEVEEAIDSPAEEHDSNKFLGTGAVIGIALGGVMAIFFAIWACFRLASMEKTTTDEGFSSTKTIDPEEQKPAMDTNDSETTEKQNSELSVDDLSPQ